MSKRISTTIVILILVLVAGSAGVSVLFFSHEEKGNGVEAGKEDIFSDTSNGKNNIDCDKDFDFIYSFGVGTSILNTKDNVYSPDMCGETSVDHEMIFTENEKKEICNFIKENDLMLIKDEFVDNCDTTGDVCVNVSPLYRSSLEIFNEGKIIKKILYLDHYYYEGDDQLEIFKNVERFIEEFISKKLEELDIYEPMCGYM